MLDGLYSELSGCFLKERYRGEMVKVWFLFLNLTFSFKTVKVLRFYFTFMETS